VTLDEFGRENGLTLRSRETHLDGMIGVYFEHTTLKDGRREVGAASISAARRCYAEMIRGEILLVHAQQPLSRREIQVPDDLHEPQPIDAEFTAQPIGLRDRFAMAAMQGWLTTYPEDYRQQEVNVDVAAAFAYRMADAMLKHREA